MDFRQIILAELARQNRTRGWLASQCRDRMAESTVYNYLSGIKQINDRNLAVMLDALKLSIVNCKLKKGASMLTLITACLLSLAAAPSADPNTTKDPRPKWADSSRWGRLRLDMPPQSVDGILGQPLYFHRTSTQAIAWYQTRPQMDAKAKTLPSPQFGALIYSAVASPNNPRPQYQLSKIIQPDWDAVAAGRYDRPAEKIRLKPIRVLKPIEKKDTWQKLSVGMDQQIVEKLLGTPESKKNIRTKTRTQGTVWTYAVAGQKVLLVFSGKDLAEWAEPFWPEIDKQLYKPADQAGPDPNVLVTQISSPSSSNSASSTATAVNSHPRKLE